MKKRVAMLLLVFAMVILALAGCGGKKKSPVVGEWKMTTIEVSGITMDVEQFLGIAGMEDTKVEMSLKEDGSFKMDMLEQQGKGTWELKGSTCTLTIDGDSLDAEYKDGKLILDMDGEGIMTFEKQ